MQLEGNNVFKPLLSICIPTYNRAEYLVESIESIIHQAEFKNKQVEIIIADNASTDNTKDVVKQYVDLYDNIHYYRNDENINNDNFPFVISKANGVLRRLCNDTLCFKKGALRYICKVVKKYEQTKPFICWLGDKKKFDIKELDFRQGIKEASFWITSIASFSIWDTECINIEKDTYGAELLLWQVRKSLELASEKNAVVVINKNLTFVQNIPNKNVSYGLYHVFYENYFILLNPYFKGKILTAEDKNFLEEDLLLNFFSYWCVKWKMRNSTLQYSKTENLYECIYQQFHNKPYWGKYLRKYSIVYRKEKMMERIRKVLKRDS